MDEGSREQAPRQGGKGVRGAGLNAGSRFDRAQLIIEEEFWDDTLEPPDAGKVATQFLADESQSIISSNSSPDIPFDFSLNPYRGCEHGCAYCYARPTHEYLGYSAGLDFETRILYKPRAAELLREELARPSWKPRHICLSGVTDPYQPVERRLKLTRACLEVLAECRQPISIITKNALVARDIDLLAELARFDAAVVALSVTSLDRDLQQRLEPRSSPPAARLETIRRLREAGIPAGGMMGPVIPGVNEHEILPIAEALAAVGATFFSYTVLRMPHSVTEIFADWLDRHAPDAKEKVLGRVREIRGGKLSSSKWGERIVGEGPWADQVRATFAVARRRHGLDQRSSKLSGAHFRRPALNGQLQFDL
jgi:DNA repair photolyase